MAVVTTPEIRARNKLRTVYEVDFDDDGQIVDFVKQRWERRDEHRLNYERQWYINIAQYLGYQYHTWDGHTSSMVLPPAPSYRVRLVANRLMPIVRKVVSKLLRARPEWVVIPATQEEEDQMIARIGAKVLHYYWRTHHLDKLIVKAATWMGCTGNVFMRVIWDPTKGAPVPIDEEQILALPEQYQEFARRGIFMGDLSFELVTPFELDPDPEALELEESTHILHTRARSLAYLEDRYGEVAEGITPDASDDSSLGRYWDKRVRTLSGPFGVGRQSEEAESYSVLTHSLWLRPTPRYPQGIHVVVAGGRVLQKGQLPHGLDEIPYVHLQEIPVPGRFWATCALEQAIPLQSEYNTGRSRLCEVRNLMAKPKWLVPRGSGVGDHQLTSEAGEKVLFNYPYRPEQVNIAPPGEIHYRLLEYALKDIEDGSAQHEVTQARAPSGVRSGTAIAQLQEQDDQMLAPTFLTFEHAFSRLGAMALKLLAQNATEDRILSIVGKDKEIETMVFSGKNLLGQNADKPGVDYFDVECQMGSQLPLSRQGRIDYVVQLVNSKILDPVGDRKLILRALELGTEEPVFNEEQLDRQTARRENLQLTQGMMVMTNDWDNDEVHLEEHTRYEKQPEFQKLAQGDPVLVQRFAQHKYMHALRAQQIAAMRAGTMQQAPASPATEEQGQAPGAGGQEEQAPANLG